MHKHMHVGVAWLIHMLINMLLRATHTHTCGCDSFVLSFVCCCVLHTHVHVGVMCLIHLIVRKWKRIAQILKCGCGMTYSFARAYVAARCTHTCMWVWQDFWICSFILAARYTQHTRGCVHIHVGVCTYTWVWRDSFTCSSICGCVLHTYIHVGVAWLIRMLIRILLDVAHTFMWVWHDSFMWVWQTHLYARSYVAARCTRTCMRHNSFVGVTRLTRMLTHMLLWRCTHKHVGHDSFEGVTWLAHLRPPGSFICYCGLHSRVHVPWLICRCDMTHLYVHSYVAARCTHPCMCDD